MKGIILVLAAAAIAATSAVPAPRAEGKEVVCYYGSWSVYRPGQGKFEVEHIDPYICTHIIYGFVGLGFDGKLMVLDSYNDLEENWGKGAMKRFTNLKNLNPNLRASVAIGGWNEGSEKYSNMVASASSRKVFIDSVIPFLQSQNFDGLDLDWEYPAHRGGKPEDRENFDLLMAELRAEFDKHGFSLTAAVSAGEPTIRGAYNVPNLAKYLDAIHVMTYDLHGAWEGHPYTHHHTALYKHPLDDANNNTVLNVDHAIKVWHELGAPYNKLVLGMGTYGRGWTLNDASSHDLYAPATNPITAGEFTREAGIWGYNEICSKLSAGNWQIVRDDNIKAPYAYNDRNWIGYDDIESITLKTSYAKDLGLLGGMIWSLETDDFQGGCHGEKFPIIKTIYRVLNGEIIIPSTQATTTTTVDPSAPTESTTTTTTTTTTTQPPVTGKPDDICKKPGHNPDPNDCNLFWHCTAVGGNWEMIPLRCGAGAAFNPISGTCDWPENVPGCS